MVFTLFSVAQILQLAHNTNDIAARVHSIVDRFADRGLRSLAVAKQVVTSAIHFWAFSQMKFCFKIVKLLFHVPGRHPYVSYVPLRELVC